MKHINKKLHFCCLTALLVTATYSKAACNLPNYEQEIWITVGGGTVNCPPVILTKINAMASQIPNLSLEFSELQASCKTGTKNCCNGTSTGTDTFTEASIKLSTEELKIFLYGISFKKQFQASLPGPDIWVKFDAGAGATLESKFILDATVGRFDSVCKNKGWP
jgi:hypothetical protein